MLLIDCPYCGKRPELEFTHGGQAHIARAQNPSELSAQEWTDFLYMRLNIKGVHAERWRHTHGCGRFFNALRDTTTDHFLATYKAGEPRPVIGETASRHPTAGGAARAADDPRTTSSNAAPSSATAADEPRATSSIAAPRSATAADDPRATSSIAAPRPALSPDDSRPASSARDPRSQS